MKKLLRYFVPSEMDFRKIYSYYVDNKKYELDIMNDSCQSEINEQILPWAN